MKGLWGIGERSCSVRRLDGCERYLGSCRARPLRRTHERHFYVYKLKLRIYLWCSKRPSPSPVLLCIGLQLWPDPAFPEGNGWMCPQLACIVWEDLKVHRERLPWERKSSSADLGLVSKIRSPLLASTTIAHHLYYSRARINHSSSKVLQTYLIVCTRWELHFTGPAPRAASFPIKSNWMR